MVQERPENECVSRWPILIRTTYTEQFGFLSRNCFVKTGRARNKWNGYWPVCLIPIKRNGPL